MDDKTLQAMTALAAKLGTTAEYLWGVLLRQAPISGAVDLLVMVAWAGGCLAWFRFVWRQTTKPSVTAEDRYPMAAWDDEAGVVLAWASVVAVTALTLICIGIQLSIVIAALVNPEYWALRQILK